MLISKAFKFPPRSLGEPGSSEPEGDARKLRSVELMVVDVAVLRKADSRAFNGGPRSVSGNSVPEFPMSFWVRGQSVQAV